MKTFKELLNEINACAEAREWASNRTIEEVLRDSWRGDWLLWLAKKLDLPLNKLTLAKARCAKTVIHLMKDQRSIDAVNIAEKFGLDECSLEELNAYADAAYAYASASAYASAYTAAYAASAYASADASAYAAASAYASADASAYAAYASADASAYASAYASADAASAYASAIKKNRQQTSDICVDILGELIIEAVNSRLTK